MEDFLWDRGLKSHIVMGFAQLTFSERLLRRWTQMQQRQIRRGEGPCMRWKDMKVILRRRFVPPFKPEELVVPSATTLLGSKPVMHSSLTDSLVGDGCLKVSKHQDSTIKDFDKTKVVSDTIPKNMVKARNVSCSKQHDKGLAAYKSKCSSLKIFERHVSGSPKKNFIGPKQKDMRSAWCDSITEDAVLTECQQQAGAFKSATKMVATDARNLHGSKQIVLPASSENYGNK